MGRLRVGPIVSKIYLDHNLETRVLLRPPKIYKAKSVF